MDESERGLTVVVTLLVAWNIIQVIWTLCISDNNRYLRLEVESNREYNSMRLLNINNGADGINKRIDNLTIAVKEDK